ncbi:MAG: uracil-DNA glycosylase [Flavobacteriales bacterium]
MQINLESSWKSKLEGEFDKPYFIDLVEFVKNEYTTQTCYPPGKKIFAAFDHTPFDQVKVVIIGQDPYHGPGQANGLCFSVNDGVNCPPSLVNIFKEIGEDLQVPNHQNGNLERWADQGVLLLNSVLTVRAHEPASHQRKGWEQFTDAVISCLANDRENIVYLLWGNPAQEKGRIINTTNNLVLKSVHPSPLSAYRGYFGCRHFSQANDYLEQHKMTPIKW